MTLKSFVRLAAHTQLLPVLESGEETLVGGQAVIVGNSRFDILTAAALGAQVGRDAMPDAAGRPAYMAGLAFRTTSLARAAAALRQGSIPFVERDGRLVVPAREAINAVIEFVE